MDRLARHLGAALASAPLLLCLPSDGAAQQLPSLFFEARAGIGNPVGDLSDRQGTGFASGLALGYRVFPGVSLTADLAFESLPSAAHLISDPESPGMGGRHPNLKFYRYGGNVVLDLLDPRTTYWRFALMGGVGGTTLDGDGDGGTRFTSSAGLKLGYSVNSELDLFGALQTFVMHGEDEAEGGPGNVWTLPITAGVRLNFGGR